MVTARGRRRPPRREAGYNMVVLMIAITVLNIMLAAALPYWSAIIKRDKEEELRSRGLQYAEAIRVFQMRYGRQPVRLEELIEVRPRCIRKLWDDPMTDGGEWGLLFAVSPGRTLNPNDPNAPTTPTAPQQVGGGVKLPTPTSGRRNGNQITVGPIVGVHSLSSETSMQSFFGNSTYDKWLFTVELLQRQSMGRPDQGAQLPRLDLRNLGRPFPPDLQQALAQPGDLLGGGGPGGGAGGGIGNQRPGGGLPGGGQPGFPGQPGTPGGGIKPGGGRPGQPGFPGQPGGGGRGGGGRGGGGRGGGGQPGFPAPPGFPGGGGSGGGGGQPGGGGQQPGGEEPGGGGFDPTQPQNVSRSEFLPAPTA